MIGIIVNNAHYKRLKIVGPTRNEHRFRINSEQTFQIKGLYQLNNDKEYKGFNSNSTVLDNILTDNVPSGSDEPMEIISHNLFYGVSFSGKSVESNPYSFDTEKVLDLRHLKTCAIFQIQSAGLNGENILLPELIVPLVSFTFSNGNFSPVMKNIKGVLDLRPLNANGMFGGTIINRQDYQDLEGIILPTNVTRDVSLTLNIGNDTQGGSIDLSTWTRLRGLLLTRGKKTGFIPPSFVEPDAIPFTNFDINNNFWDSANIPLPHSLDLSAMHNLGGKIIIQGNSKYQSITLPTTTHLVTEFSHTFNNEALTLNAGGLQNFNGSFSAGRLGSVTSIILPPNNTSTYSIFNLSNNPNMNYGTSLDLSGASFSNGNLILNNAGTFDTLLIDSVERPNITSFNLSSNNMKTFDFDNYTNPLGLSFLISNQPNLQLTIGILNIKTNCQIYNTGHTGVIDLSSCSIMNAVDFRFNSNPNVTDILFPPLINWSSKCRDFYLESGSGQTEPIDFTEDFYLPSRRIIIRNNLNPFIVNLPAPGSNFTGPTSNFILSDIGNTTIDLSGISNIGALSFSDNLSLTTVILNPSGYTDRTSRTSLVINYNPSLGYIDFTPLGIGNNNIPSSLQLKNNTSFTSAIINEILVDLATIYTNNGISSGSINCSSSGVVDSSSGGFDGLQAVTDLINLGITVTHS